MAIEEQAGNDKRGLLNRGFRWIDLKQLGTIGPHCDFYFVLQVVRSPSRASGDHSRSLMAPWAPLLNIRSHGKPWTAMASHFDQSKTTRAQYYLFEPFDNPRRKFENICRPLLAARSPALPRELRPKNEMRAKPLSIHRDLLSGPSRTTWEFDGHRDFVSPTQADQAAAALLKSTVDFSIQSIHLGEYVNIAHICK